MTDYYSDPEDFLAADEKLDRLAELIGAVSRPGDYCTHGRLLAPMPRIRVGAADSLSFPIPQEQVDALFAEAERAPYGRGEETILDRSVRDCWQIASDRIELGGSAWGNTFKQILESTAQGLGYPADALSAELYKLLVYEPGGFFLPHRDTEKADRMVATLVVSLPVEGLGGELVVRHLDRETVVDMTTEEPSQLVHAAFYADCEHEIWPVISGYRVCLVFNLLRTGGDAVSATAPDHSEHIEQIASELRARCEDPEATGKIVWLLEHDYSEAGLSFGTLKNVDDAVGRVLVQAARLADCAVQAATLHIEVSGGAYYDGSGSSYGGWFDEDDCFDEDDWEMEDADWLQCWLDGWRFPDGSEADFGRIKLSPGEVIPEGRLDLAEPDSRRLLEASGNEGATFEKSYRGAALIIWSREGGLRALAEAGLQPLLQYLFREWRSEQADEASSRRIQELALKVVENWRPPGAWPSEDELGAWPSEEEGGELPSGDEWHHVSAKMLSLLVMIGSDEALTRFLDRYVVPDYRYQFNHALAKVAEGAGTEITRHALTGILTTCLPRCAPDAIGLFWLLHERLDDNPDSARRNLLRETVVGFCTEMAHLYLLGRQKGESRISGCLSVNDLCKFLKLVWHYDLESMISGPTENFLFDHLLVHPNLVIPEALEKVSSELKQEAEGSAAFDVLWKHAAGHLLSVSGTPPVPPSDWARDADLITCNCSLCRELRRFASDPNAEKYQFAVRKDLRKHIESSIRSSGVDMRSETVRQGSPHKLLCTKTRATYQRRLSQYRTDIGEMRRLTGIADFVDGSAALNDRLIAAIGRAE